MKKIILSVLFIVFCFPAMVFSQSSENTSQVKTEKFLNDYRLDPFQWIYPEYFYKADIINVEKEKVQLKGYTKVVFFGLSAYVPSEYAEEITRDHDNLIFESKSVEKIYMLKASDDSFICSDERFNYKKDFCSAFKTSQELLYKLFTLTPDTAKNIGDKWIVHDKGIEFENVKKIEIYSNDRFMAYVKFIKDSLVKEEGFSHEISLFHTNGPLNCFVNIRFISADDTILKNFLSTLE